MRGSRPAGAAHRGWTEYPPQPAHRERKKVEQEMNYPADDAETAVIHEVHILRLNIDKTMQTPRSGPDYQVHFELSAIPPDRWMEIFQVEWNCRIPGHAAGADGNFLVIISSLPEIGSIVIPALKYIVELTNASFVRQVRVRRIEGEFEEMMS